MSRGSRFNANSGGGSIKKYLFIALAIVLVFLIFWTAPIRQKKVETAVNISTPKVYRPI